MAKVTVRNRNKGKLDKNGKAKKPNWEYRFEMASIDGKRKQASKSGFRTQKEAYSAGLQAFNEYNSAGKMINPSEMSFADYLDEWYREYAVVNLRHSTCETYSHIIKNHLKPALGHYRLSSLDAITLQRFFNSYRDKDFSAGRVKSIRATLRGALSYAVEPAQYIKQNPMQYVKMPPLKSRKLKSFRGIVSIDEWQRITDFYPFGHRYHVPLMIGYHTGLRISETLGLTWDDIDLENGAIYVTHQLSKYRENGVKWCFAPTKTKTSIRAVKIGATLLETLKREKARQAKNRLENGEQYVRYDLKPMKDDITELVNDSNGSVFPVCVYDHGKIICKDSMTVCFTKIRGELGINTDYHSLRHSHATILAESGANVKNLQARLGHGDIRTTLRAYVHDTEQMSNETIDMFERAIGKK